MQLKIKENSTTIIRHTIQIIAFLTINYIILELIFPINLIGLEEFIKILPVLNSPRNPLSSGAGILEYIFYALANGIFPFLMIAILLLVLLISNRFFCGWICPIGAIEDACAAIPTKKRKFKTQTHQALLKIKYVFVIIMVIIIVPLGVVHNTNNVLYSEFKESIGAFANQPVGYFSLSEFLFVYFPKIIQEIFPFKWEYFGSYIIIGFYFIIILLSVWYPRFYCRYFCPFAAVASAVTDYSFLKLSRNPVKCVGRSECGECERVCPKQIRILDEPFEFFTGKGECNLCLKCKEKCPYKAIGIKFINF